MPRTYDGPLEVIAQGFKHAEGPAFDAAGRLWVTDWRSAILWRVHPDGWVEDFCHPGGPNGGAFHWNGDYYMTDPGGHRIARVTPDGAIYTVLDTSEPGGAYPNDLTFHPSGAIYFTKPVGDYKAVPQPPARVYRIDPNGAVTTVLEGLLYPNGINVSADGARLYVAESHTGLVSIHDIQPDGSVAHSRLLCDVREGQENWWAPDGMCLDVAGNLYVAVIACGRVRRVRPDGVIDLDIPVPGQFPTNCCFGGPANDDLYITEGRRGEVYKVHIGIPGLELYGPRGWRAG